MKRIITLFMTGGAAYVLLELAFRQCSHITMFFAGGTCFLLIHLFCNRLEHRCRLWIKCLTGATLITAVELGFGLLFNRNFTVWDYSALPLNFLGQICLPFSILWAGITFPAMKLAQWLEKKFLTPKKEKKVSV